MPKLFNQKKKKKPYIMMKTKNRTIKTFMLMIALNGLFACGGSTSDNESAQIDEEEESSCLAELVEGNEIEKMVTAAQIAEIVGKTEADLTFKDEKSKYPAYSSIVYNWDPEKERMMTLKMEIPAGDGTKRTIEQSNPLPNKVIFGNIDVLEGKKNGPREYFRYTYGPKTAEEKEAIKNSIDKSKESSDKVDEKSAETIKSMVDKQSSREVEGVGDLAYWDPTSYGNFYNESGEVETEAKIRVLHGNTMFTVSANISNDIQEDLELAKKVAKQIVANCE